MLLISYQSAWAVSNEHGVILRYKNLELVTPSLQHE